MHIHWKTFRVIQGWSETVVQSLISNNINRMQWRTVNEHYCIISSQPFIQCKSDIRIGIRQIWKHRKHRMWWCKPFRALLTWFYCNKKFCARVRKWFDCMYDQYSTTPKRHRNEDFGDLLDNYVVQRGESGDIIGPVRLLPDSKRFFKTGSLRLVHVKNKAKSNKNLWIRHQYWSACRYLKSRWSQSHRRVKE